MPLQYNEQKIVEAASILLECAGGKMNYMLLLKLLYYADRYTLKEWERPITYDRYVSMNFGPVLSTTYDLILQKNVTKQSLWNQFISAPSNYEISLKTPLNKINKLSDAEIEVLKTIFKKYGHEGPFKVSKRTHGLPEYKYPDGSSIPITMGEILKALKYSEEDINRITSEMEEEESIVAVFGG